MVFNEKTTRVRIWTRTVIPTGGEHQHSDISINCGFQIFNWLAELSTSKYTRHYFVKVLYFAQFYEANLAIS